MVAIEQILDLDITGKNIMTIGPAGSGKSWLAMELWKQKTRHLIVHTDDFMKYDYVLAMYKCLEHTNGLIKTGGLTIVEGIQGYRMLRKGVEYNSYYPDIVIQLHITLEQQARIYAAKRKDKDAQALKGFNRMHDTILKDYHSMYNPHKPVWITVENSYMK